MLIQYLLLVTYVAMFSLYQYEVNNCFYFLHRYSTVFLDPKTGSFVYSNRIVELFPEREGSPDNWFFNDQGDEPVGTNTVPRSASVPPIKQLQSFVSSINGFIFKKNKPQSY